MADFLNLPDRYVVLVDENGFVHNGSNPLPVTGSGGGGSGGMSQVDKTQFVEGVGLFTTTGGVFSETIVADPNEDQAAAVRITAKRAYHVHIRDENGVIFGDAANPFRTDPTGTTTQPVSDAGGSLTVDDGGITLSVDDGGSVLSVDDNGGSLTVDGTVAISNLPGSLQAYAEDTPHVSGDFGVLGLAVRVDTPGSLVDTDGDRSPLQVDNLGRLRVATTGAGSGVSQQDKTAFTEGVTNFAPVGGVFNDTVSADLAEDEAGAVRLTAKRAMHTNLRNVAGTEIATAAAPLRTDPTGATTQPVSDAGGSLTIDGTVTIVDGGGSITIDGSVTIGTALPAGSNNIGDVDVVSLPAGSIAATTAKTFDLDSGAGTDTVAAFGIALPASGGAVVGGTATDPLRTDPTGTTTQPISDAGGSLTVDDGGGSLTIDGTVTIQDGGNVISIDDGGGSITVDGTVATTQSGTWTVTSNVGTGVQDVDQVDTASLDYDSGAGTVNQTVMGLALPGSGGPVAGGTPTNPVRTDPTGTTAQPVTDNGGTLSIDDGGGLISIDDGGGSITVDGSVTIGAADNTIGRVKLTDGTTVASIRDFTNANPLDVAIVDASGNQITSFGSSTQYTEGDTDATITGNAVMWEDAADTLRPVSAVKPLPVAVVTAHNDSAAPARIALTNTTEQTLIAAPGPGLSLYVMAMAGSNDGGSRTLIDLKEGAGGTIRYTFCLAPRGGGFAHANFLWKLPANTALRVQQNSAQDSYVTVNYRVA